MDFSMSFNFIKLNYMENPFILNIQNKDTYTIEEYADIQNQLTNKNIDSIIESFYPPKNYFYNLEEFKYRCSKSLKQKIIHQTNKPTQLLYKIGPGEWESKNCIVCCAPFSHDLSNFSRYNNDSETRYLASQQIIKSLEDVGFEGFFYLFNGGFPNPTGTEMKYAGVPYCFKIFMMLEAKKKGFDKVIWIDSGCYSINNPIQLFDILDTQDTIIKTIAAQYNNYDAMCFSQTIDLLNSVNHNNIHEASYIETIVFGFNMKSELINKIIADYYRMVELGFPFLSIFPEEIVLSSLFNKPEYKHLLYNQLESKYLQIHEDNMDLSSAKHHGYFFLHRNYKKYSSPPLATLLVSPSSSNPTDPIDLSESNISGELNKSSELGGRRYVSFDPTGGRFGNQIFKYIICKLFTILFNHTYVCSARFPNKDCVLITEDNFENTRMDRSVESKNIYCVGYFQKSEYFVTHRNKLIELICDCKNDDYWEIDNNKYYIKDYLHSISPIIVGENDICMHVRLDDFIQYPCKTSDILSPEYYIEILERILPVGSDKKLYIICDNLKYHWEHKYMEFFKKWNPIVLNNTLPQDIAIMRDCNVLIHSNSTLSWVISFLSDKKQRYIPYAKKIHMNQNQSLNKISESDVLKYTTQLTHNEVYCLDASENTIFPMSFCVPDECMVESAPSVKKNLLASLIPGDMTTYKFTYGDDSKYNTMYQESRFAITKMKGGWDCLRHYEILMNGCIPLFENLNDCPDSTLTTYPKHLNTEACQLFDDWTESDENIKKYNILRAQFLNHAKLYCTTSYTTEYFLNKFRFKDNIRNILMITCHHGINYNRESLWIGLKRYIKSIDGVAVEYGNMPFLYTDFTGFSGSENKAYTNAIFTLPKKLVKDKDYYMGNTEIVDKIKSNFWDLIIYGKVGPDELLSELPLYDLVKQNYNKNKIAFIFGGDEIFNLNATERSFHVNMFGVYIRELKYRNYLKYYSQFGNCFVRELAP
jgi:hypothetical protein